VRRLRGRGPTGGDPDLARTVGQGISWRRRVIKNVVGMILSACRTELYSAAKAISWLRQSGVTWALGTFGQG
jgi:hypothetical protein